MATQDIPLSLTEYRKRISRELADYARTVQTEETEEYHRTLLNDTLRELGFDDRQVGLVNGILEGICTHCWDTFDPSGCNCLRDE